MARAVDQNYTKLPLGAIKPDGWILSEIEVMCNLQKRLGALVGLGKTGEWVSGEALPRYVRGLTLLAVATGDKTLEDKAASFLQTIMHTAKEGGDFGPKNRRSLTPKLEGVKALLTYYEATGSEKVLHFLKKFFKNQFNAFSVMPAWYDSRARLLEEIPAIEAVYRQLDLEWLHDLGEKLRDSSNDWFRLGDKFTYKRSYVKYVSERKLRRLERKVNYYDDPANPPTRRFKALTPEIVEKEWKKQQAAVETDAVNLAKAVKYAAVYGRFVGDDKLKQLSVKLVEKLMKYHGTAMGMFAADTHLAGASPVRGLDVEAAVEMVESLVEVVKETGDFGLCDILERIVFNLIPSALSDDGAAVQDIALANQVEASAQRKAAGSDCEYGNAYITKKLSRGAIAALGAYPLFVQAACMQKGEELTFFTYAPVTMELNVGGNKLVISEKTAYPFRNTVVFKVEKASSEQQVKINFRVPKNTSMQLISGGQVVVSGTKEISVKCVLKTGSTFMLKMDIPLTVETNPDGTKSLFKGNMLMALGLAAEVSADANDRRLLVTQTSKKWNVAPVVARREKGGIGALQEPETTIVHDMEGRPYRFEAPPFELMVRCKNVINWDYDVDGFTQLPKKPVYSEESLERSFVPVGCTTLHMTQFPKCK